MKVLLKKPELCRLSFELRRVSVELMLDERNILDSGDADSLPEPFERLDELALDEFILLGDIVSSSEGHTPELKAKKLKNVQSCEVMQLTRRRLSTLRLSRFPA